jgi:hypothetical protein
MTYEFDQDESSKHKGEKLIRGRWKNACEGMPAGVLCYGFVFEEDPNGPDLVRPEDADPFNKDVK